MSLYEQFHSEINKTFMFNMIKGVIENERSIDISIDPKNYDEFLLTLEPVFNKNNVDEIELMNKYLLDYNIKHFLEKLDKPSQEMQNDLEERIKERKDQENMNMNTIDTIDTIDTIGQNMESLIKSPSIGSSINTISSTNRSLELIKDAKEDIQPIHLNSSQRTNINSSRYNYKVDLTKQQLVSTDIHSISRIIIPIEDNYLFTIPVLVIDIPELECNTYMQQDEIIHGDHRKYGVYKSIEKHTFSKNRKDRITVTINDISGQKYSGSDILKVNIIEIKKNRVYFTCSSINQSDFQELDYIKVINNNTFTLSQMFQKPFKIKRIQKNVIICDYPGTDQLENNIYTDIDMKLMNMSNQNIIFFN